MFEDEFDANELKENIQAILDSGVVDMIMQRLHKVVSEEETKENKTMSEEQKEEVRDLIEKIGTQLDGAESYLRNLYQLGKETETRPITVRSMESLRQLSKIRSDFQIGMDLNLF